MKTFLFQGDSITDANRDRENDDVSGLGCGYALQTASYFTKNKPAEFVFFNRGVSGDRVTDIYARIYEDIINLEPDYMSILVGVNDVAHQLTMRCGVATPKYERIYSQLISEVKQELPDIKIIILEPFILKGTATDFMWEEFRDGVKEKAQAAKRVAEKFGLTFVPLQDKFNEISADGNTEYWSADGVHPTSEGHRIIKEELLKAII